MHSVGRVYITRSLWDEGLGGLPHPRRRLPPPKKTPVQSCSYRWYIVWLLRSRYTLHPIGRTIILSLSILRWVISTVMGMGQGSGKSSDEPLRTGRNPLSPTILGTVVERQELKYTERLFKHRRYPIIPEPVRS